MRDPKTEKLLDAELVDYEYLEDVPLDWFDADLSLRNQARIDPPLFPETVTQYVEAMRDGAEFPALVGYFQSDESIVLVDGNHRLHAHLKHGTEQIDVYVVDAAPDVIQALTYMANATHGRPPSDEERIQHGIHLKDLGYSVKDAARVVAISEGRLTTEWGHEQLIRRARKLQVEKPFNSLKRGVRKRLGPISNDNTFKALVSFLAASKGLTEIEVGNLINSVKDQGTEEAQLQSIVEFRDAKRSEQRSSGRTKHRLDARRSLLPHLGYIHQQDAEAVRNATLTPEQRENLKEHLIKTVTFCNGLMKLLVEDENEG